MTTPKTKPAPATIETIEGGYLVRWGGGFSVRMRNLEEARTFAALKGWKA